MQFKRCLYLELFIRAAVLGCGGCSYVNVSGEKPFRDYIPGDFVTVTRLMAFKDDGKCVLLGETARMAATEGIPLTDTQKYHSMARFADFIIERGTVLEIDKMLSKWVHPGEYVATGEIVSGPLAGIKVEVRGLFVSGPKGGNPSRLGTSFSRSDTER